MLFNFESPNSGLRLKTFSVGPLQCNCSILWDTTTSEGILIDPGADFPKIQKEIEAVGAKIKYIVHTHAHFDHIGASNESRQWTQAPLCLHPEDRFLWENVAMQGQLFGMKTSALPSWNEDLEHEKDFSMGGLKLTTLFTPGHTPGSCSFAMENLVFAGDTLFLGSIGRTDLWGGNFDQLSSSVKTRLYQLDEDTTVICGHGPNTKIGIEKRSNPFVQV